MEDVYPNSGKVVARKLVAALIPQYPGSTVSSTSSRSVYLIEPKILHWEDRATEWSGKADRVKVSLPLYRSGSLDAVPLFHKPNGSRFSRCGANVRGFTSAIRRDTREPHKRPSRPGPENRACIRAASDNICHMPALANPRHEKFAQAVASGKSASEAYRQCGANGKNGDMQAAKLVVKGSIRERIAELKEAQS
jgi:hypothetical protein